MLYPDARKRGGAARQLALLTKRLVDVGGTFGVLLVPSPLMALIVAAIKLSSKGSLSTGR